MTILSIGMIVKNEALRLRKTLEALQPLRDALACQLIIADTGSSDGTIEIAQEFADVFLQIPWENDFAKARNATLAEAAGSWFFYLDADEVLTEPAELIKFFSKPSYKNYQCASILIRNRVSESRDLWQDFTSERLFRRHKNEWFVGAIHESYPRRLPVYELKRTHIIHYGYNNDDQEFMRRKGDRNLAILEDILAKSESLDTISAAKLWLDYADSLMLKQERSNEAIDAAYRGIELLKTLPEDNDVRIVMMARAYGQITRTTINQERNQFCLDAAEEYWLAQPIRGVWDMDIYCFQGWAQMNLGHDAEAADALEHYLTLLAQEKSREVTRVMIFATEDFKDQTLLFLCQIYQRLKRYEEMWQCVQRIEKQTVNDVDIRYYKWQMAIDSHSAERIPELYFALDEDIRDTVFDSMADAISKKDSVRLKDIAAGLRKIAAEEQAVWPLLALATDDVEELAHCLGQMQDKPFTFRQGAIIRQCLKLALPMRYLLPHLNIAALEQYVDTCASYCSDWIQWAYTYYDNVSVENMALNELWLGDRLLSRALLSETINDELVLALWPTTVNLAASYLEQAYQKKMLEEENRVLLSRENQFFLLAQEVEIYRNEKKYAEALALLRQGLLIYPEAQRAVALQLSAIEQLADPAAAEMKQLARTVKDQIRGLIEQDDRQSAKVLVDELLSIVPEDLEALELQEKLQTTENDTAVILWH